MNRRTGALPVLLLLGASVRPAMGQDPGKQLNTALGERTKNRIQLSGEVRQRFEDRTGIAFGRDRDLAADYVRSRLGATWRPAAWVKVSGMMQDARAAGYGLPPPGNVRDPFDLQEGYIELFSAKQTGLGLTVGRQMIGYGDTRISGSPQWAYTARTWDTARLYHVTQRLKLEFMLLSPVQTRGNEFNRPVLGDRLWGTYNTLSNTFGKTVTDFYVLRHDQNRPGGFTGQGRLGINAFGSRWAIPLPGNFRVTLEGILQNGKVGPLPHRAGAGVALLGHKTTLFGKPLDLATEYKYASGTDPNSGKSGTFDQFYPAAHDKVGHVDLIGWRNVHNIRSVNTLSLGKKWQCILMYNNTWLADPRDAIYTIQGRPIVRSADGSAGRHAGQELDLYTNYQVFGFTIAAGVGRFFPGEFVKKTTPGANSALLYLSTSYSF
ncbi:MAG: alginate export family protein [Bryobacterales bacterium]|nr:alginate export family protein [Bryobacterales bacterium]